MNYAFSCVDVERQLLGDENLHFVAVHDGSGLVDNFTPRIGVGLFAVEGVRRVRAAQPAPRWKVRAPP